MENEINLRVIWFDEVEDLLEVVFSCSNGYFAGQAEIYVTRANLSELAETLGRFPFRPVDSCDFELGTFNPEHAQVRTDPAQSDGLRSEQKLQPLEERFVLTSPFIELIRRDLKLR